MFNLRVFSNYSFGESILTIEKIINLTLQHKQKSVALIDRMNMCGAFEFSIMAIKKKIKPILGCLMNIDGFGYLPVLIKNQNGYEGVCTLLTNFYSKYKKYLDINEFIPIKNDIIILYGGNESYCNSYEEVLNNTKILKNIFKENLYIEVQNYKNNNLFLQISLKESIPIVATNNVYFCENSYEAYYAFTCISESKIYDEDDLNTSSKKNNFFLSKENIKKRFLFQEGIDNLINIEKRCNFYLKENAPRIPKFTEYNSHELLREKTLEGLKARLLNIPKENHYIYYERLNKELKILQEKDFSNYFLITSDFINEGKKLNISVGPGRGSGTGSLVAYSLNITNIDPIKFGLIFERFLNPQRKSLPDLDIDFCQEKRYLLIDRLKKKYGENNIVSIITFNLMKSKMVLRDVGRVLGIPLGKIDSIAKFVPQDQVNPVTLGKAVELDHQLKQMFEEDTKTRKLLQISLKLEGLVRHVSTHAAGIVITKENINRYLPLYRTSSGDLCTQFSMKYVELSGLVKFDFLGLQTLTLIEKVKETLKVTKNISINIDEIPIDDISTYKFICNLQLSGVFQIDSLGMKSIIYDLQPDCLDDIIALISLFRPGPMKDIPKYINRKKGKEKIEYIHPLLEKILSNTYGIIVYQEQVLEIAVKMGGYSLGEADTLRRAMGKKILKEMAAEKDKFLKGCIENNISLEIAENIFNKISDFAGYGFNKSHAAPYAYISYITAYLKNYYPLEFMGALMSLDQHDTDKLLIYVNDLIGLNKKLLPPSIQKSNYYFSVEGNSLRFGLGAIKNVGENLAKNIQKERENNGLYLNIENFVYRNLSYLNKRQLEYLIYSGSLKELNNNKDLLLDNLVSITRGESLIYMDNFKHRTLKESIYDEIESLGFFLTDDPFKYFNIRNLNIIKIKEIITNPQNKGQAKVAGIIRSIIKKKSHHTNKTYMFVKLMDGTGLLEVTFFGDLIEKKIDIIKEKQFVVVHINYEKKSKLIKCICYDISLLHENKNYLFLYPNRSNLLNMANILKKNTTLKENYFRINLVIKNKKYLLNDFFSKDIINSIKEKKWKWHF
ncbi:hypothetical protein AB836_01165 [Rickettsiales bacterium (ex Bugula neritina AB1)]|nr:hypothetical protein AB836_01165 [Rickettsiales bacterium (ex Bugula neritina AB1)]